MPVVLNVVYQRNSCEALFMEVCFALEEARNSSLEARLKGTTFFFVISRVETVLHKLFVINLFLQVNL